jgi:FMN reductase
MRVTAVVGNPKPASRTADAATLLASELTGMSPDVIDLVEYGPRLLGWGDSEVRALVERVRASDVLVVASPTYKATYTGLLKLFLDQLETGAGLSGVVTIPLMLGAGPAHELAPDLLLKPVLVELGAICPTKGLYLLDSSYREGPALGAWLETWGPVVNATVQGLSLARTVPGRGPGAGR